MCVQVKKRLDYQLEVANVVRRMEQKHMVDWIISNVRYLLAPRVPGPVGSGPFFFAGFGNFSPNPASDPCMAM